MAKQLTPKIEIKKTNTWMGSVYRIYIDGRYFGAGFTQASAREGAKKMLHVYERIKQKERKAR
jgi:hypothetical protein